MDYPWLWVDIQVPKVFGNPMAITPHKLASTDFVGEELQMPLHSLWMAHCCDASAKEAATDYDL